jgi:hypothetical protein
MAKKTYRIKTEQKAVIRRTYLIEADSLEDAEREIDYEMENAEGLIEYWESDKYDCPSTTSAEYIRDNGELTQFEIRAINEVLEG